MNADGVVTEIPTALQRLVRLVMRGFYSIEHVIVTDMLIRNPCMKEDDLVRLLKFERKQLRSVIAQLKNDRLVKIRLRMETRKDGKATRQNYYYINYRLFVNVVKYKLDHLRKKIEMQERDSTSRASFRCTCCQKTFTDLEADQLCDFTTGEFRCTFCNSLVEEDERSLPKTDSRLLLARFNEQIEPLYNLLREVEDIKLAPELLEPEPYTAKKEAHDQKTPNRDPSQSWSGDATRNKSYLVGENKGIVVNFEENSVDKSTVTKEKKEQPVWMMHSTIINDKKNEREILSSTRSISESRSKVTTPDFHSTSSQNQYDIMEALLAHERKSGESMPVIPGQNDNEESSSESEDSMKRNIQSTETQEMESDYEEEILTIQVGDQRVPLTEVTAQHVEKMTTAEKETYIRLTQDIYASMYE